MEAFSNDVLPKLFSMRTDVVANIRVCLARVITTYILNLGKPQIEHLQIYLGILISTFTEAKKWFKNVESLL